MYCFALLSVKFPASRSVWDQAVLRQNVQKPTEASSKICEQNSIEQISGSAPFCVHLLEFEQHAWRHGTSQWCSCLWKHIGWMGECCITLSLILDIGWWEKLVLVLQQWIRKQKVHPSLFWIPFAQPLRSVLLESWMCQSKNCRCYP